MLSDITVTVRCVLKASEIRDMPDSDLDRLIADTISNNAFEAEPGRKYRCRGKAKGLEGILYRCADCGALYTTRGKGNSLVCSSCGAVHTFDETYRFKGRIGTIADYYDRIKDMEADTLDTFRLEADVRTTIFGANGGPTRRETGRCTLSPEGFSYHSGTMDFSVQMRDLPALAYSCSKEFELYHDGELMYFYPTENPTQVARWALLVDMMAQRRHK